MDRSNRKCMKKKSLQLNMKRMGGERKEATVKGREGEEVAMGVAENRRKGGEETGSSVRINQELID